MPPPYTIKGHISQTTFWDNDHPRQQIEELIEQATLADPKLHKYMQHLSNTIKNESGKPINYVRGTLKTRERIAAKCGITNWDDPKTDKPASKIPLQVKDISRATIEFSTIAQMNAFRDYISMTPEFEALKGLHGKAVKDLWSMGVEDQYKDVKFFLQIEIDFSTKVDGKQTPTKKIPHIVELQLNVGQMAWGKVYGHAFYNISRLARLDGEEKFVWNDPKCVITVPTNISGKCATKLRAALTHCRGLAQGDKTVLLAVNILSKFLSNKFKLPSSKECESLPAKKHYDYKNRKQPLVIRCGKYNWKKAESQDSSQAQAWAIAYLAAFVWSNFTKSQHKPGITGTAASFHEK